MILELDYVILNVTSKNVKSHVFGLSKNIRKRILELCILHNIETMTTSITSSKHSSLQTSTLPSYWKNIAKKTTFGTQKNLQKQHTSGQKSRAYTMTAQQRERENLTAYFTEITKFTTSLDKFHQVMCLVIMVCGRHC